MMSLFSGKGTARFTCVLNVGSAEVRAALVRTEAGKPPHILYATASHIPFLELTDRERYERAMLSTLLEVVMRLSSEKISQLSSHVRNKLQFVCVLSSPWFVEATRTIIIKKTKPFQITTSLVEELGKKEERRFIEEISKNNTTKNLPTAEVERELLISEINGYPTHSIFGRTAQELRCTFHFSDSSSRLQERIKETLVQQKEADTMRFASSTYVAHKALGIVMPEEKNFLQVVVSGECTDISLIERGILVETQTFPHGTRSVLRSMMAKSTMSIEEAEGRVALYLSNKQALRTDEMYGIFQKAFDTWVALFEKTAMRLSQGIPLPQKAVVVARSPWHDLYETRLKTITLHELTHHEEPLVVSSLTEHKCLVCPFVQYAPGIPFDILMATDIVGILSDIHTTPTQ